MREILLFGLLKQSSTRHNFVSEAIRFSMVFLILLASPDCVTAQGNFATLPNDNSHSNQWSPPTPDHASPMPAPGFQAIPSQSGSIRFPQESIPFDPGVKSANFETPLKPDQSRVPNVNSTFDSTTGMIANLRTATGEQLTGMAAKMKQDGSWMTQARSLFGSSDISRMLGSLTLVLGIYFAFIWLVRKFNPGSQAGIPAEVVDVMGHIPFGPKRELQLVRLGSKLLLLMSTAEGTNSIGEITDPDEAEYLASLCLGKQSKKTGSYAAIRNAANRLAARSKSHPSQPGTESQPNLANILRTLDQATRQNSAVFEA